MEPVQDRQIVEASIGENTSKAGTTIGKCSQRGVFSSSDGVEVMTNQHFDIHFGSDDGAENLAAASLCFDVAHPYLQVTLSVLATSDEGGIQGDRRQCYRRKFRAQHDDNVGSGIDADLPRE